jgi:hypothetical protein
MKEGQTLLAYVILAHEQVKVPLLANVALQILEVEATFDRVVEMVQLN